MFPLARDYLQAYTIQESSSLLTHLSKQLHYLPSLMTLLVSITQELRFTIIYQQSSKIYLVIRIDSS